ncbi:MAG: hypothetical protein IKW71_03555, partial [Elusimicrobiaceae bacterium]|nr:hypothetical protein [Elusimicrobiaceae bacterium]
MSEKWIVALDQGTSGCRACAIDEHGIVRATQHKIFSPDRPQKGLSSYDGEELLSAQKEVLNTLLDQIGPQKVAALAVCSQRSTVVLWNKRTGKPLAPVLTWEDGRSLEQSNAADISQEQVHQQTGLFKTPFFSAPKITWCLEHCPAVASAAQAGELLAAPVASYFIWHLTGADVFATDPTLAQRTLLWDIAQGTWSETLCNAFKISPSWLPQLQPTVSNYGTYLYKGVSIPICVCVADQQAAAFCETGAQTLANYGTGAFVLHPAGDKLSILPGMLSSISASGNGDKPQFLLEGPIFAAGSILQWLKEVKKINFEYDQLDLLAHASTSPVQLLPALGGLGAPYWDYHVQAVVENVTSQTQVADWVAGSLRAIAARVAD